MHEQLARSIHGLLVLTAWADGRVVPPEVFVESAVLAEVPQLAALYDKRGLADAAKRALDELGLGAGGAAIAQPLARAGDAGHALLSSGPDPGAGGSSSPREIR